MKMIIFATLMTGVYYGTYVLAYEYTHPAVFWVFVWCMSFTAPVPSKPTAQDED